MVTAQGDPISIKLWHDNNPPKMVEGAITGEFYDLGVRVKDIGIPSMRLYLPKETNNTPRPVMLLCPGGGYHHLTRSATGNGALEPFLLKDMAVAVLLYRTTPPHTKDEISDVTLLDAQRAVRLLRHNAEEWGIDPEKIGVVGWSAGANLTLNLATHFDEGAAEASDPVERESSRPNIVGLLCPWPWRYDIKAYPVSENAPPAFIASAKDDTVAPTTFAQAIASAYKSRGVQHKLWLVNRGGHGAFSGDRKGGEGAEWEAHFWSWLTKNFPEWATD